MYLSFRGNMKNKINNYVDFITWVPVDDINKKYISVTKNLFEVFRD